MPRQNIYTAEQRESLAGRFAAARNKKGFARRTGVPIQTLYGWAAKARRTDAPAPSRPRAPGRPRTVVRELALPPPPAFDIGDWARVLDGFETVGAVIARMPPAVADAVLRTHLHRLHIPGLGAAPAAAAEREGAAE